MIDLESDTMFFAGYTAAEDGLTIDDCEFDEGSVAYADWMAGYKAWMNSWLMRL